MNGALRPRQIQFQEGSCTALRHRILTIGDQNAAAVNHRLTPSRNVVPTEEDTQATTNPFLELNIVGGLVATVTNDSQIGNDARLLIVDAVWIAKTYT
jgi:hypothetical protein